MSTNDTEKPTSMRLPVATINAADEIVRRLSDENTLTVDGETLRAPTMRGFTRSEIMRVAMEIGLKKLGEIVPDKKPVKKAKKTASGVLE